MVELMAACLVLMMAVYWDETKAVHWADKMAPQMAAWKAALKELQRAVRLECLWVA